MSTRTTAQENIAKLPHTCWSVNLTNDTLIRIKAGEHGFYNFSDPKRFTKMHMEEYNASTVDELADLLNAEIGVTRGQREAMEIGSMHDWDVPGANPDNYDASGRLYDEEKNPRPKRSDLPEHPQDFLEEQQFSDIMNNYRTAPFTDQMTVIKTFENVKEFIRQHLPDQQGPVQDAWIASRQRGPHAQTDWNNLPQQKVFGTWSQIVFFAKLMARLTGSESRVSNSAGYSNQGYYYSHD